MINACCNLYFCFIITVHGDIRHLEIIKNSTVFKCCVHGDIRHLENCKCGGLILPDVHGDIRHLEINRDVDQIAKTSSWRHTPFRKI